MKKLLFACWRKSQTWRSTSANASASRGLPIGGPEIHSRSDTPGSRRRRLALWLGAATVMLVVVSCSTYTSYRQMPAATPGATYVGMRECSVCHDAVMEQYKNTVHGRIGGEQSCEACHGPASIHVEKGEGFIVQPNDANCLQCHSSTHKQSHASAEAAFTGVKLHTDNKALADWAFADHQRAGVKCMDCHNAHSPHAKDLRESKAFQVQNIDATSSLCLSCHQQMLGRISMPYHHPIREGTMGCISCHNPHGSQSRELLAKNETCAKCHQAQQGPFAREHQPVVEDCTSCHDPHGAPTRKMTTIGQPMLCLQCHSLSLNRHQQGAAGGKVSPAALRDCTSCHGSIHGSDMDAYFRH